MCAAATNRVVRRFLRVHHVLVGGGLDRHARRAAVHRLLDATRLANERELIMNVDDVIVDAVNDARDDATLMCALCELEIETSDVAVDYDDDLAHKLCVDAVC